MSVWHVLGLLLIVVLVFGTSKLRNIGSDLGGAVRDFKKGLSGDEDKANKEAQLQADPPPSVSSATQSQRDPVEPK